MVYNGTEQNRKFHAILAKTIQLIQKLRLPE